MFGRSALLGCWCVAAMAAGCTSAKHESPPAAPVVAGDQPWTRNGDPIEAPAGARWSQAYVSIEYRPPERGYHARHSGVLDVSLHLTIEGQMQKTRIDEASTSDYPSERFQALAAARPQLRTAPDGRAMAFSMDDGAHWWLILVDAGDRPFSCVHAPVDPTHLPVTRDFILDLLRNPAPHWSLRGSRTPRAQMWSEAEVRGALEFAQANPDDGALREAWATYLVRPGRDFPYGDSQVFPIQWWMQSVACDDDRARRILLEVLGSNDSTLAAQRGRAAQSLARCARVEVQDAVARVVRWELDRAASATPDELGFTLAKLAWSLASITNERRAASPEAFATLVTLARGSDHYAHRLSSSAAQVSAVRALAVIPTAAAREVLNELATRPPAHPNRTPPSIQWPREFTQMTGVIGGPGDVGDWARAALAANP